MSTLFINEPVSGLRHHLSDLRQIYIVVGDGDNAGRIKTEYWSSNKDPGLAKIEWHVNDGRRTGVKAIRLDADLEQRGWLLLEAEYKRENRMEDWKEFLDFQRACRNGEVVLDKEQRDAVANDPCPGFPNDMLPASVQALIGKGKGPKYHWKPKRDRNGEAELASQSPTDDRGGTSGAEKAKGSRARP